MSVSLESKPRFLLDENVHRGLFPFLSKLGYDIMLTPKGFINGKIFELAKREGMVLITRDSDFLDSSIYSKSEHFGIIFLRIPPRDLEAQKKAISELVIHVREFKGKIFKLE